MLSLEKSKKGGISFVHHIFEHLEVVEASVLGREDVYRKLRKLGLSDFASVLWAMPDQRFPHTSSVLPKMATEDTQREWTGYVGETLLSQSISFMRAMSANYAALTGNSLQDKKILDFGCGYGRLMRLASFYSANVYGVDPWIDSLNRCEEAGITNVSLSDYLPQDLPVQTDFDFVYAFSVFTHLSERAMKMALGAIHKHVVTRGILCITIRPVEYWRMVYPNWSEIDLARYENHHHAGFAFYPHARDAVDGDVTYGDTSMTLDYLATVCSETGWRIRATDRTIEDPVQRFVFLERI